LKSVFENYLLLSEKKGSWLKNFETFLNQLPDPVDIPETSATTATDVLPFRFVRPNPMGLKGKALEAYHRNQFDPEKDYDV